MIMNHKAGLKQQSVSDFYDGKSVFITGGTGFLGKVFIAKLLLDCPKIHKIYLLVREKRGVAADKRVLELLDNPLFSSIRKENPDALHKIVPIAGDISASDLGITANDEKELVRKVSIVFHVAATIKFNEPLPQALKVNVEGTIKVLKLCQRMENIKLLVHISTAYAQCLENVVEEIIYPPPADLADLYILLKQTDHVDITDILNGWPNTYTFTKALAENFLAKHHGDVPIVIVRPSIVAAIKHGPLEGWTDNWYGATGILVPIAKGLNRVLLGDGNNLVDLIPVDYVTNLSIIAAATHDRPKEVVVYNVSSSSRNPVTLKGIVDLFVEDSLVKGDYMFPFTRVNFILRNKWLVVFITFILQIIPAYVADALRRLRGKPPRYIKLISHLIYIRDTVEFFTSNSWVIKNDGVQALYSSLSPEDQKRFPCDPSEINWQKYVEKYYNGVRRYVEKKKVITL